MIILIILIVIILIKILDNLNYKEILMIYFNLKLVLNIDHLMIYFNFKIKLI